MSSSASTPPSKDGGGASASRPVWLGDPSIPTFQFGSTSGPRQVFTFQPSQGTDSQESPITPKKEKPSATAFQFGQGTPGLQANSPFTFRSMHNITPLASPQPSPRLSPRTPESRATSVEFDTPLSKESGVDSGSARLIQTFQSLHVKSDTARGEIPTVPSLAPSLLPSPTASQTVSSANGIGKPSIVRPDIGEGKRNRVPYDVRNEQTPAHEFFTLSFQKALQDGLETAKKVANLIEHLTLSMDADDDLARLLSDAKHLSSFVGSDTRTIAVLGDSGEGKSSLINSLLHYPGIAKTGDIGSACTSVVTEYRQKTRDHTAPITIEVEYLSGHQIEEMVKELLWSYRQLFLPGVESDTTSETDYARYVRESEQAWSALEAAFKSRREFKKELLQDMSDGALERIESQLIGWTREIEWPAGGEAGRWQSTADDAEECCEKTSIFMEDGYWPFTKIIRIFVDAQVLKTGLVLADLPGLQDTNLARVRATQKYLVKCSNIFIVAKISRAITDQSLKSSLYNVLSRHVPLDWEETGGKDLNLAIVCTKSEDINLKSARDTFCGPNKSIPNSVIERLDVDIAAAKASGDRDLKKELKRRQEWLLIQARTEHVKEGLRKAYSSKVPSRNLDVFCISNTTYEKYSRKGNKTLIQASGIPQVRQFCHSITAAAQHREATHLLRSSISSLLSSLDLWAKSNLVETDTQQDILDESIYSELTDANNKVLEGVQQLRDDYHSCFQDQILKFLENRDQHWEKAAKAKGEEWLDWHWKSYQAFCHNNGNHSTAKHPHQDWNAEIIWKMRMELAFQWEVVQEECSEIFETLVDSTKTHLMSLKEHVEMSSDSDICSSLARGIESKIEDLEYKIEREKARFTGEVKLIRGNASESNYNSYILKEMIPTYRSASSQSGKGTDARQKGIVQGRITNGTLFPNIAVLISTKMATLVDSTDRRLRTIVMKVFSLIKNDIDLAFASQQQDGSRSVDDGVSTQVKLDFISEVESLKSEHSYLLDTLASR